MKDQMLDQFLAERTAAAMKRIEDEIYAEVSDGICAFFGADNLSDLTEDQIEEVSDAQKARDKGFIKLGYNLVLKLRKWIGPTNFDFLFTPKFANRCWTAK